MIFGRSRIFMKSIRIEQVYDEKNAKRKTKIKKLGSISLDRIHFGSTLARIVNGIGNGGYWLIEFSFCQNFIKL